MEDEGIKSAFEIAMERISGLPRLTPEEIADQKEKELRPIGEAMAKRYMDGLITSDALPRELEKHQGEQGRIVRRALIRSLCRSIDLDDPEAAFTALAGIMLLETEKAGFFYEAGENLRQVIRRFERETEEKSREFAVLAKQRLAGLGISGSAVQPNLDQDENWQRESARMREAYEPRVADLRGKLLRKTD